jgi:hypothetical protein
VPLASILWVVVASVAMLRSDQAAAGS